MSARLIANWNHFWAIVLDTRIAPTVCAARAGVMATRRKPIDDLVDAVV
jgi:hypothetical protein